MPEPKAQLIDPQGPIDVPGLSVTGVTTATGGFVGNVQGAATGLASTTSNLSVGIVTATKFQGNTTGNVSGLADGTNINVGIITSTSFTGDLVGNAAGLSTTTANINAGIMSATSFSGNFTGVASGITGTPNIVVGIMTGTLNGDGSSLTGIAATNWITNNVTANSSTTTVDLALGNVVKFTQSADTTVSFANTGTSNIVSFIRLGANYTITWPSTIKWNGGSAPTLNTASGENEVFTLLTRDEGITWYGWETVNQEFAVKQSAFVWGNNENGELGINVAHDSHRSSPVQLPGSLWNVTKNRGDSDNVPLQVKSDGTMWAWGSNSYGLLGQNQSTPTKYSSPVQIPGTNWAVCSGSTSAAIATKTDGTLWTWGRNNYGTLGHNNAVQYSSPVQIPGTSWPTTKGLLICSSITAFAIKTDGTLWGWGRNGEYGSLGVSDKTDRSSPVQIPGTTWSQVDMASSAVQAIKTDGTMWGWGYGSDGQLGLNQSGPSKNFSSPKQIPGTTWAVVDCGYNGSTMATKTDGTLWGWGNNTFGELGFNTADIKNSSPTQIPGTTWSTDINKMSCGTWNSAHIKTDGTLWVMGHNGYGNLGQNNTTQYSSPVQIPGTWDGINGLAGWAYIGYKNT